MKPKACKVCRAKFEPARPLQTTCSIPCAIEWGRLQLAKKQAKEAQEQKRKDKAKREELKRIPDLIKEAQEAFNRYVRLRDNGKGCFVCGAPLLMGGIGGGFDAGHIRPRSQAGHLRYDERNVFGQCKPCNAAGSTKDHEMRAAAERLLGKREAEALYADNRVHKWQRDELRAIRDLYRAKAKALENYERSPNSGAQLGAVSL